MGKENNEIVVARFNSREEAQKALKRLEDVLEATGGTLAEGSLVTRKEDGEVDVVDLQDTDLRDIVAGAADLTFFIATGLAKIAFNTAVSGVALLMRGSGRLFDLASSVVTLPVKRFVRRFVPVKSLANIALTLNPGAAAVVIEANERLRGALEETLATAGGEVVNLGNAQEIEVDGIQEALADLEIIDTAQEVALETAAAVTDAIDEQTTQLSDAGATVVDVLEDQATRLEDADDAVIEVLDEQASRVEELATPTMDALEDRLGGQDLSQIEGIGPVIASTLNAAGIVSFADLAATDVDALRAILIEASVGADPTTWPEQAKLAMRGKWEALEALQDRLKGGRQA